jgi:polysaccharide biosynthesis transport protein
MEIGQILKPLLRWWWLILAATLISAVSSFFAVSRQPPTYRAATTLMIGRSIDNPNPSGMELSLSQQLTTTYVDIAQRQPVRQSTMAALGVDWLPNYSVRQIPNSQLLEIAVVDTNPEVARVVANELANQLILQSPTAPRPEEQERAAFIDDQLASLQRNIEETENELIAKQAALEEAISAREIADLESEIRVLQSKLDTLQSNYAALLSNTSGGAVNTLTVIEPAVLPRQPIGPNTVMTILTAAAIGFALSVGAAYLMDYLDDTIKSTADLKRVSNLPMLPAIPDYPSPNQQSAPITYSDPRSPTADAFRAFRTGVLALFQDDHRRTLLVTGPKPRDGKSSVASNLAVVMAQAGHNVLLVDADLRRPVQHELFQLAKEPGLTDLLLAFGLANRVNDVPTLLQEVIQPTAERRLSVMTSGMLSPDTLKLLNSEIVTRVLAVLATRYDFIVIDSPPVLAVSDAVMLSTQVGHVLVVAEAGTIRRKELAETLERLANVGANVIGLTLNRVRAASDTYYYRYGTYYMRDTDGSETDQRPSQNGSESELLRKWALRVSGEDKR